VSEGAATFAGMDIILIPGLWLDASSWDDVVPILEQAGHRTHPLTLPGMESTGADRSQITLTDHVDAVVRAIDAVDPTNGKVALVGHSQGGVLAYAASDQRVDQIAHVVYVASEPHAADHPPADDEASGWTAERGEIPLPDWSFFDDEMTADLDESARARIRERAVPSPEKAALTPSGLSDDRRLDIPSTVIACEYTAAQLQSWIDEGEPSAQELGRLRALTYIDLPGGHWPQFTQPHEVAAAILGALDRE
jgi:pimeloyl-ACP methyl ester carboxylesterase